MNPTLEWKNAPLDEFALVGIPEDTSIFVEWRSSLSKTPTNGEAQDFVREKCSKGSKLVFREGRPMNEYRKHVYVVANKHRKWREQIEKDRN